jgi:hypothetical protein
MKMGRFVNVLTGSPLFSEQSSLKQKWGLALQEAVPIPIFV